MALSRGMSTMSIDNKSENPIQLLDLSSEILVNIFKHYFPTWSAYIYNHPFKRDADYFMLFGIPSGALIFTCSTISPLAKSAIRERFDGRIVDVSDTSPWSNGNLVPFSKVESLVKSFGIRIQTLERPKWKWNTGPSVLNNVWHMFPRLKQTRIMLDNLNQIPGSNLVRFLLDCNLADLVEGNLDVKLINVLGQEGGIVDHMLQDYPMAKDIKSCVEFSTVAIYPKLKLDEASGVRSYRYHGERKHKLVSNDVIDNETIF